MEYGCMMRLYRFILELGKDGSGERDNYEKNYGLLGW